MTLHDVALPAIVTAHRDVSLSLTHRVGDVAQVVAMRGIDCTARACELRDTTRSDRTECDGVF